MDYNLTMTKGESKILDVTFTDEKFKAIDITNAEVYFIVKKDVNTSTIAFQKAVGSGIVITNPTGGVCRITVNPPDTATLSAGGYIYGIKIVLLSGQTHIPVKGQLNLIQNVF